MPIGKIQRKNQEAVPNDSNSKSKINYYTLSEISNHDSNNDLWMIIHDKIYDVTSIIDNHPGGAEVLFECGGLDASEAFDDVGHSQDSVRMLKPLFVGYVKQDKLEIKEKLKFDNDLNDDDIDIKRHSKNLSLGESLFFKEFKKKQRKKFKDKYFNHILLILAIITGLSYMYIITKKEDDL